MAEWLGEAKKEVVAIVAPGARASSRAPGGSVCSARRRLENHRSLALGSRTALFRRAVAGAFQGKATAVYRPPGRRQLHGSRGRRHSAPGKCMNVRAPTCMTTTKGSFRKRRSSGRPVDSSCLQPRSGPRHTRASPFAHQPPAPLHTGLFFRLGELRTRLSRPRRARIQRCCAPRVPVRRLRRVPRGGTRSPCASRVRTPRA